MRLLLDTHYLIWSATEELSPKAVKHIEDASILYFSTASIWEVVLKHGKRKGSIIDPHILYTGLLAAGYAELQVTAAHALAVRTLPHHHKDPFDRILIAQAITEKIQLLTADEKLVNYPAPVLFIPR